MRRAKESRPQAWLPLRIRLSAIFHVAERAPNGHAAAPPRSVMNFWRCMSDSKFRR
jgi:hypothetical protein